MLPIRWLRGSAFIGFALTLGLVELGVLGFVDGLVTLGAATIVPLGAALARDHRRGEVESSVERLSRWLVAVSAIAMPLTSIAPRGSILIVTTGAVHFASACVLAFLATRRLAWRLALPVEELAIDLGCIFLPVGAGFALASRAGVPFGGFDEPIVTFTAAHFHYAGFAAPVVLGCVGRLGHTYGAKTSLTYRAGTLAVVSGIPLTAAGISGGPMLERSSAVALAAGMVVAALRSIALMVRGAMGSRLARGVVALSFLGILVPMALAATFALTGSAGRGRSLSTVVSLATMIRFHGAVNALVFAIPALAALSALDPRPRHAPSGFPMSRLRGTFRVGADFFARLGALGTTRTPTGIIDDLDAYASASFDVATIDPEVRRFYEHTADYDLELTPHWSRGFRTGGRVWRAIARRIGQVELPTDGPTSEHVLSRIVDLRDDVDGRARARGWVRTYTANGRALYVAAYAATPSFGTLLMNIAFPLPFGALVSVLRFDSVPTPGGLRVSTASRAGELVGDEGIYFATRWITIRLPMLEWVEVLPSDTPGETTARHELYLCGLRYLVLDYRIARRR